MCKKIIEIKHILPDVSAIMQYNSCQQCSGTPIRFTAGHKNLAIEPLGKVTKERQNELNEQSRKVKLPCSLSKEVCIMKTQRWKRDTDTQLHLIAAVTKVIKF